MKENYDTAFERETDLVCGIVARNRRKNEYEAVIVPVRQMNSQVKRQSAKCVRMARKAMCIACTVCATMTAVAALGGDWQSAFAGAAMLLVAQICARITD